MTDEAVYLKSPSVLGRTHTHTHTQNPKTVENQPPQQNEDILTPPAGYPLRALGYSPNKSFLYLYLLCSTLGSLHQRNRSETGQDLVRLNDSEYPTECLEWRGPEPGGQECQRAEASLHQKHHHGSLNSRTNFHKRGNFMEPCLFHRSQLMNQWGNEHSWNFVDMMQGELN